MAKIKFYDDCLDEKDKIIFKAGVWYEVNKQIGSLIYIIADDKDKTLTRFDLKETKLFIFSND